MKNFDFCILYTYTTDMTKIYRILRECTRFEWDQYNIRKNWEKHHVSPMECEQTFFNKPLIVAADVKYSQTENRY